MPRTNIDYSKTIIYKLCCKDLDIKELYVGHTTDMRRRKTEHKSKCNNEKSENYNLNVYQFIRANGGFENFDMIEVQRYNAIDGYDAKKKERYWIDELKASLNCKLPTRTKEQWEEDNKEKIKKQDKEYYENNLEYFKEKQKKYNEKNKEVISEKKKEKITCECGCLIRKDSLKRHQQTKRHIELMSQKVL